MTPSLPLARPPLLVEADGFAVADQVAGRLHEALASGRTLGLATGRTMEPVYRAFVARLRALPPQGRQRLISSWSSFNLDEYVGLGDGDACSFAQFMALQLGEPLDLPQGCLRLPDGRAVDPEAEAIRYAQQLRAAGGIGLQLLGLGRNGHVGFNEPPCRPEARCRCLTLSASTRQQNAAAFGGDPQAVPARAITLGLAEILAAETVLLVVTVAEKAEILRRSLQEAPCPEVPASWLQHHRGLQVIADQSAASALCLS
ncbi:MAG: glucosamine-6-phosphate deaminase [Vulcanococcus sp.]